MKPAIERIEEAARLLFKGDDSARPIICRLVLREVQIGTHPDGLRAAIAKRIPGCCIFCEERLSGRRRAICAEPSCKQAYQRAHHRDRAAGDR